MGVLFELLAQLIIAFVAVATAHFGAAADAVRATAAKEPPAVQRTLLKAAPGKVAAQPCPEEARLHRA